LLSVDFDSELIFAEVVEQELSDAIYMMLMRVIELWCLTLAFTLNGGILGFVHIELVFAEDIAVVLDQIGNL